MGGRRKQEDEREVEKEEGPKGGRHGREERKQILDTPSRDTQWKNARIHVVPCDLLLLLVGLTVAIRFIVYFSLFLRGWKNHPPLHS